MDGGTLWPPGGPLPFSRSLWSQNPRREQTSHLTVRQVLGLA